MSSNPWDSEENQFGNAPELPFQTMPNNFDVGSVAPIFGIDAGHMGGADYLDINIKGRSNSQKLLYNTGTLYLAGILGGGAYGITEGLRNAPSHKFKIRLNSVLNASGKRGSRSGNALGVLALFYSSFDAAADHFEVDRFLGDFDQVLPVLSGAATGALYKCTGECFIDRCNELLV